MTVTGSNWQALTLGKLVPALDPDDPKSAANKLKGRVEQLTNNVVGGAVKVENVMKNVASTLNTIGELGKEIQLLQNEIDNLIGNAINTGIYAHLLGCNPIASAQQPLDIVNELRDIYNDKTDPNRPQFRGTTATIGSLLLIITAPNPAALIAQLKMMMIVFPMFKSVVATFEQELSTSVDIFDAEIGNKIKDEVDFATGEWGKLTEWGISTQPFEDLFDGFSVAPPSSDDWEKSLEYDIKSRWMALRLSQMIPALNPSIVNSPANIVTASERALVSGGASLLQQASGFATGVNQLAQGVNLINRQLKNLAKTVTDLVDSLGRTGIYVHLLGLDGSINNTDELNSAAGRAMIDLDDPNRPRASGEIVMFAGFTLVFGGANPAGFAQKLGGITNVFGGLEGNVKSVGRSLKF
jgi:CII-binding regulator of phage lambda lysogenization HflD